LDFRVEAKIGYFITVPVAPDVWYPMVSRFVTELSSEWSAVQTFTMPGESSSPLPSQTATQPTNLPTASNNNQPQLPNQTQSPSNIFSPFFLL